MDFTSVSNALKGFFQHTEVASLVDDSLYNSRGRSNTPWDWNYIFRQGVTSLWQSKNYFFHSNGVEHESSFSIVS